MTTDLADWLTNNGFTMNPDVNPQDIYDNGPARVVVEDEGHITVYRFTNNHARLLEWEAHFSHAPTAVIIAAVQAALATWSTTLGRHVTVPD